MIVAYILFQRGVLWLWEPELYWEGLADVHGGQRYGLGLHGPGSARGIASLCTVKKKKNCNSFIVLLYSTYSTGEFTEGSFSTVNFYVNVLIKDLKKCVSKCDIWLFCF